MKDEAGYDNYYVGKLMNYHNATNYNKPYPAGFAQSVRVWSSRLDANQH